MAGGEVCFDLFTISAQKLVRPTKVDVGGSSIKQCCTTLNALAETVVTDELKNDNPLGISRLVNNEQTNRSI